MNTPKKASLCSSLLLFLMFPLMPRGHVQMGESVPAKGGTVSPVPESVQRWFSGGAETEWSKIVIKNADNTRVDTSEISHINDEPKVLKDKHPPSQAEGVFRRISRKSSIFIANSLLGVPGYAFMLRPMDSTNDQLIPMVVAGECPTSNLSGNWVTV